MTRRRIDLAELVHVREELLRRSGAAVRTHLINRDASDGRTLTYYHLGRHDGLKDAAALLQALIDWVDDVQTAHLPRRPDSP